MKCNFYRLLQRNEKEKFFGGVGILHRKNLSAKLFVVAHHSEGRCVAVTLDW